PHELRFVHARLSFSRSFVWDTSNPGPGASAHAVGATTPTRPAHGEWYGGVLEFLGCTCGLLCVFCGRPELPRRDAEDALEVIGELALVREAGVRGDLRQGEVAAPLQELLGPFDAAGDDVLVRLYAFPQCLPP